MSHIIDFNKNPLVIGRNYHTTWQSHKSMRFVLVSINEDKAVLATRNTNRKFTTNVSDLLFINSSTNRHKALQITKGLRDPENIINSIYCCK